MSKLLVVLVLFFSSTIKANSCSYQSKKVDKYSQQVAEWKVKAAECKAEQEQDSSKTCFWVIKNAARKEKKLEFWQKRLKYCKQPCSFEDDKVEKYEKDVARWDAKLAQCKLEQEHDSSKTCFWHIKIADRKHGKLSYWKDKAAKCKDKHKDVKS